MQSNFYITSAISFFAISLTSTAIAAKPVFLHQDTYEHLKNHFQLRTNNVSTKGKTNDLQLLNEHSDSRQIRHLRFQQYYRGFPVVGGFAVIHAKKDPKSILPTTQPVVMNGTIYYDLENELGVPSPNYVQNTAIALEKFKRGYRSGTIIDSEIIPVVYMDEHHQAHWAYQTSAFITHPDKMPEKPRAILDASTYEPYLIWDDVKTSRISVSGLGSGGNAKTGEYYYGVNYPNLSIKRDETLKSCYMENKDVHVIDMGHEYSARNRAMRFDCLNGVNGDPRLFRTGVNGDGYDRINGAFSPANDALYSGNVIKNMYKEWYGLDVLSQEGRPLPLIMRVHYGENFSNAFWDGRQMTFGDGGARFHPLVSLGIAAHEISHGFTEQYSNLMYVRQSGGINEAFSDMAAQAAEYYAKGSNTWNIGSEVMKNKSRNEALRYMDRPSRDGVSIDSAQDYVPEMNVHHSSGVYNRLFYLLANSAGWNTRKAFDVMVKANIDYWTPTSTFDEAGCGVVYAAKDLGYAQNAVSASMLEVGLNPGFCMG